MRYEIKFCVSCYAPHAMELARKLLEANAHVQDFTVVLASGAPGEYTVSRDGQPVFTRGEGKPLPSAEDIVPETRRLLFGPKRPEGDCC